MALIKTLQGISPQIAPDVFLAENAVIIGQVTIGAGSSIWYNVVLRGDVHTITIGEETNIQDGSIVHCTWQKAATRIGNRVTIGHMAMIHGCTLHDDCLIGMGSTVMDHAVVEPDVIVGAGSLVLENMRLESGWLYAGRPAKPIKRLTDAQVASIRKYAENYRIYSTWYREDA
ncbi:MAG: gamma carbonic anhydrase family protein [Bacteroidetes bacterium]|nr:gamma carbonic anhydrase family protein [Bacteroidota bacterium]